MSTTSPEYRESGRRYGFTLVELLVVIAVVGLLVAMLLPAVQAARAAARRVQCSSNFRQLGIAMMTYCDMRKGRWPETTHSSKPDPVTGKYTKGWIYSLAPYLENVDEVRTCPDDPLARHRIAQKMTSFTMNGYLTDELPEDDHDHSHSGDHDHDHEHDHSHGGPAHPVFPNRDKLAATSKTIIAFELSEKKDRSALGTENGELSEFNDHVHSFNWFSASNVQAKKVFDAISGEVAVDRHSGSAHYLYADGHVESISSEQIANWAGENFNFALPVKR